MGREGEGVGGGIVSVFSPSVGGGGERDENVDAHSEEMPRVPRTHFNE